MANKPLSQKVFEQTMKATPEQCQQLEKSLLSASEELLPELQAHLQGRVIHHPLVVTTASSNAHANYLLLARRYDTEQAEQEGDWFKYVFIHERPYQLQAFMNAADRMDDESYWSILADVYTQSENLHRNQMTVRQLLTAKRPKREMFMTEEDRKVFRGLPENLTIYRGFCFNNAKGWSWTLSKEKAEWFAHRFAKEGGGVPRLATAKITKSDAIAYIDARGEREIICDPRSLEEHDVERLDGVKDEPRILNDEKEPFSTLSQTLRFQMSANPLMTLAELRHEFETMEEQIDSLISRHGDEIPCNEVSLEDVDSELLRSELDEMADSELGEVPCNIEDACIDLEDLISEHGGDALCGNFQLSEE